MRAIKRKFFAEELEGMPKVIADSKFPSDPGFMEVFEAIFFSENVFFTASDIYTMLCGCRDPKRRERAKPEGAKH